MLLDTNFLIGLIREEPEYFQKATELQEKGIEQRLPSPVIIELYYGAYNQGGDDDELRKLDNLFMMYDIVETTLEAQKDSGIKLGKLPDHVEKDISFEDARIATLAEERDETVLTRDDDFDEFNCEWEEFPPDED